MKRFFLLLSCCLLMAVQGLAAPLFQPGSGVVAFTAYKPFADRPVNIYYHFPESADPATAQVLMLIPGAGRDACRFFLRQEGLQERKHMNQTV